MKIDLTDTTASKINKALVQGRRAIGTPAVGMVLTLVIVTDEENAYDALKAANDASREHPSRTLVVIKRSRARPRPPRVPSRRRGAGRRRRGHRRDGGPPALRRGRRPRPVGGPAAAAAGRPRGRLVAGGRALDPANDPLGALAQRRVTDTLRRRAARSRSSARAGRTRPGDTDLSWTRITPVALDAGRGAGPGRRQGDLGAEVEGEGNPSCELLADVARGPAGQSPCSGPCRRPRPDRRTAGHRAGPIVLDRADGSLATSPYRGSPTAVALKRRDTAELMRRSCAGWTRTTPTRRRCGSA